MSIRNVVSFSVVLLRSVTFGRFLRFPIDRLTTSAVTGLDDRWLQYHDPVRDGWDTAIDEMLAEDDSRGDSLSEQLHQQLRQQLAKTPTGALDAPLVGMFDSGIGGFTVYAELKKEMPNISVAFLSDIEGPGYSKLTFAGVASRARGNVAWLHGARGVHATLVACNLASIAMLKEHVLLDPLYAQRPVIPIIPAFKEFFDARAELQPHKRKVGILSTDSACLSGVYQDAVRRSKGFVLAENSIDSAGQANTTDCVGCAECHMAVDHQSPWQAGPYSDAVEAMLRRKLRGYLDHDGKPLIDYLVLACTHFPVLSRALRRVMGPSVLVVDPAVYQAKLAARLFHNQQSGEQQAKRQDEFYLGIGRREHSKYESITEALRDMAPPLGMAGSQISFSLAPCSERFSQQGVCLAAPTNATMFPDSISKCTTQMLKFSKDAMLRLIADRNMCPVA